MSCNRDVKSIWSTYHSDKVRTGIAKELEQGKAEATIQMIRNMLCAGLQINQITQIDQLSEEKVKKILEFFAS